MRRRVLACALPALFALAACTTGGPPPLVTSEVAQTSAPPQTANELIVGVEDLDTGFNPHALADVGPVSLGVAGLVLPSPFRPDADGALRPDPTLITSAAVTAQQPFTVVYQLRREASWSDGAPIAAEDFAYLAGRMRTEPGVANPAGYRLIRQVNSRSGGKQVEVVFDRPYPGWRTLFANLLPAHLLKDAPGGWPQALEGGIPVSGGPFAVRAVDRGRGMVVLERNDRYWEVPAVLDRLVLRKANAAGLVSALATGGDQLAMWRADAIGMSLLRTRAPALTVRTVPEPVAAELLLRPAGPNLSDPLLRAAVGAALDVPDLVAVGSGNGPAAQLPELARTLLPSQPGYTPTAPGGGASGGAATPGLGAPGAGSSGGAASGGAASGALPDIDQLLINDGYQRVAGRWTRDGVPLTLVVAAPAERDGYRAVATRVVRQLAVAGIEAQLVTPSGDDLFASLEAPTPALTVTPTTPSGPSSTAAAPPARGVDIAVVPRPVSGDPAADLVSWYGCPPLPLGGDAAQPAAALSNPAGYCARPMQAAMDDLLTGASTLTEVLPATEAALWRDLPSIPLFQHAVVLVTTPTVTITPGSLLAGPLAEARLWRAP
jgi:ABC-type transport system substrate-binding protein